MWVGRLKSEGDVPAVTAWGLQDAREREQGGPEKCDASRRRVARATLRTRLTHFQTPVAAWLLHPSFSCCLPECLSPCHPSCLSPCLSTWDLPCLPASLLFCLPSYQRLLFPAAICFSKPNRILFLHVTLSITLPTCFPTFLPDTMSVPVFPCLLISRSPYFFSLITSQSAGISLSVSIHVIFSLQQFVDSFANGMILT